MINIDLINNGVSREEKQNKMEEQLIHLQNEIIRLQLDDLKKLSDNDIFNMFQNIIEKIKQIREDKKVYTNTNKIA